MATSSLYLPDPPLCPPEPVFYRRSRQLGSLVSYLLPTHWACYFLHDDPSGLDEKEIAAADDWWRETFSGRYANCVDADQDYGFTAFHDAAGYCLATDCTVYRFLLLPAPPVGAPPVGALA